MPRHARSCHSGGKRGRADPLRASSVRRGKREGSRSGAMGPGVRGAKCCAKRWRRQETEELELRGSAIGRCGFLLTPRGGSGDRVAARPPSRELAVRKGRAAWQWWSEWVLRAQAGRATCQSERDHPSHAPPPNTPASTFHQTSTSTPPTPPSSRSRSTPPGDTRPPGSREEPPRTAPDTRSVRSPDASHDIRPGSDPPPRTPSSCSSHPWTHNTRTTRSRSASRGTRRPERGSRRTRA